MELGYKKEINLKPDEAELINKHLQNKSNPHNVNASQVGVDMDADSPEGTVAKRLYELDESLSQTSQYADEHIKNTEDFHGLPLTKGSGSSSLNQKTCDASGRLASAFGEETHSKGDNAFTRGYNTTAEGKNSTSDGKGTYAKGDEQNARGRYNIIDKENKYVDIVGNGTSNAKRSNAYTLDWDGNAEFAGEVKAKGEALESTANKVTAINENSTDEQYPSAKAVWDKFNEKIIDKNVSSSDDFDEFTADYFNLTSGGSVILKGYIEDEYNSYILFVQAGHEDVLSTHQTLLITNCYGRSTSLTTRIYDSNKWTSWDNYLKKSTVMKSLTYDDMPTEGSNNLLTSGTIHKLNETKVDKYYKQLFPTLTITEEDITNAGDEGITQLVVGDDKSSILETINELYICVEIPKSSDVNTTNYGMRVYILDKDEILSIDRSNGLLLSQSSNYAAIEYNYNTRYVVKSEFSTDKNLINSIFMKNGFGVSTYPVNMVATVPQKNNISLFGKKTIAITTYTSGGVFKFPKGTTVTVYGK